MYLATSFLPAFRRNERKVGFSLLSNRKKVDFFSSFFFFYLDRVLRGLPIRVDYGCNAITTSEVKTLLYHPKSVSCQSKINKRKSCLWYFAGLQGVFFPPPLSTSITIYCCLTGLSLVIFSLL